MKPIITIGERPRIFVQIASYRDPECQHTVKDLFDKATYPERITVGICWQFIKEEDAICFQVPYPHPKQVRLHEVDARQGRGVCWARSLTQALYNGEEFTLQIDSHMRFEQGWDEILLSMWTQCKHPKAVLTCYPSGYTPPDKLDRGWFFCMSAKEFDHDGILKMHGKPSYKPENPPPPLPMRGAFVSANMLFGPATMIRDVPYDPHLYFFGEEITLAVRLWTHGYDLFHPNGLTLYHDWDRSKRPTHFTDHVKTWQQQNASSLARVRHLLGTQRTTDPEALVDIEKYGLGTVRSLKQYERYSGVNFAARTFSNNAANGIFNEAVLSEVSTKNNNRIFVNIASYRDSECQWTVKDLFEKATHPERINVGICWQFDEKEDAHCFEVTTRPEQVRVYPVDWRESEGVCWARAHTEMLMEDEAYTLQIDSHTRFAPGWDEFLIAELALCPSSKAVLSCAPAKYTPPNNLEPNPKSMIRTLKPFTALGDVRGRSEFIDSVPEAPLRGAIVAGGCIFARSEMVREVPYDPYLYFDQEEIMLSLRLYSYGWDVYAPRRQMLYHYYNTGEVSGRPLHWRDLNTGPDKERFHFLASRGLARFNHLTGHLLSQDSRVLVDIEKYGVGSVRSVADFEAFVGIDFKNKIVLPKGEQGGFIPHLERYRRHPIPLASHAAGAKIVSEPLAVPVFTIGAERHQPVKIFESRGGIAFDNFLPEKIYQAVRNYAIITDYEHINTKGKITRAWHVQDRFPLRSLMNAFYYADVGNAPSPKPAYVYPTGIDALDRFIDFMVEFCPQVERYIGRPGKEGWTHFSVTSWLYPPDTGLAMHDDGSGVYSGAYAFFMNKTWRPHWGGLLILMDDIANDAVHAHRRTVDQGEYHQKKWLHANNTDEILLEYGLARCIFPKGNRVVFIANDAYHMITRVNEAAGDNVRMSLAGFFDRTKK